MRQKGGWYEEDCEWALVALVFPQSFQREGEQEQAKNMVRGYYPETYAKFFNVPIESLKGQSYAYDRRLFQEENADKWVVVSACSSPFGPFPYALPGMVCTVAVKGGRDRTYGSNLEERYFFVPKDEYDERSQFGFVIDENKHVRHLPDAVTV